MMRLARKLLPRIVIVLIVASLVAACGDETNADGASPETLQAKVKRDGIRGKDRKAPVVSISSPTTSGSYSSADPTFTLAGRAKDNKGISSVRWYNDRGDNGEARGTTSWSVDSLPLNPGENTFTVTVQDYAGNSTSASIVVTFVPDEEPPVVTEPPEEPPIVAEPREEPPLLNEPPVLSGLPPTAVVQDTVYGFTPTAADPDGDRLTFSINNKPDWAEFDQISGTLSGVPGQADLGTTYGILITVSDGATEVSLSSFDLTVEQIALGSVTLAWTPPSENIDGTPLTDLAGYKIYYGSAPGNYSAEIIVDNPGISRYLVDNLTPNNWYFVVAAYDLAGHESEVTNEARTTIQ